MGLKISTSWRPHPMKTKIPICRTIFWDLRINFRFVTWISSISIFVGIHERKKKEKRKKKKEKEKEKRKKKKKAKEGKTNNGYFDN